MAIINHTHRFVFIHVPKNAGTSVSRYLSQLSTYRDQEIGATALGEAYGIELSRRFRLRKHSTYREIEAVIGADDMAAYSTIAVVRDPFHRVRSMYSFMKGNEYWRALPQWQQYIDQFDRLENINDFVASEMFSTTGPDRLFMPQVTWLADDASDTLLVDHVLRLESLKEDMPGLVEALDFPADALGEFKEHANASKGRLARVLNPASIELVRERYRRDFDLLNYDIDALTG